MVVRKLYMAIRRLNMAVKKLYITVRRMYVAVRKLYPVSHSLSEDELRTYTPLIKIFCLFPILGAPLSLKDDFSCLSHCLFLYIGHEINLTGLLAEILVSPITLTKCLSAIRCPLWNSMLCVNCRSLRNTNLSGV